jgi:urease accessory protein
MCTLTARPTRTETRCLTSVTIARGPSGTPRLDLRTTHLTPRVLDTGRNSARIALVGTTALLLAGDHVELDIAVGDGCRLELVDVAGTVAYHARGGTASWTTRITVGAGAVLTWAAEPFVVADGANVRRSTRIELDPTGVVALRETLVLGRAGESGGALDARTVITWGVEPLLVEHLDLTDPAARTRPGILGTAKVLDSALLLGCDPPIGPPGPSPASPSPQEGPGRARVFQLAGPGAVGRHIGPDLHLSPIGRLVDEWIDWARSARV